jgi:hypothetical protein
MKKFLVMTDGGFRVLMASVSGWHYRISLYAYLSIHKKQKQINEKYKQKQIR